MKDLPIPLPLLVLVLGSVLAAVVFLVVLDPASAGGTRAASEVPVRLLVVGPDRKPRQGIALILVKNPVTPPVELPPSGPEGRVDGVAPPGTYRVEVFPRRLSTAEAQDRFREERHLGRRGLEPFRVLLTTLAVPAPAADRTEVRLPAVTGY